MPAERHVRATYSDESIVVYQAYPAPIADAALAAGTFVAPFKRERMTWIKPSFLWMMYRSGWGEKPGQERILAIELTREGFEWALAHSSLSHHDRQAHDRVEDWTAQKRSSPVRVQWDPERSLTLGPLPHRAIQIGLSGEAVTRYVEEWIRDIKEVTGLAHEIHRLVSGRNWEAARAALPAERVYPLPEPIRERLAATGPEQVSGG
jgi:hypothetical protein